MEPESESIQGRTCRVVEMRKTGSQFQMDVLLIRNHAGSLEALGAKYELRRQGLTRLQTRRQQVRPAQARSLQQARLGRNQPRTLCSLSPLRCPTIILSGSISGRHVWPLDHVELPISRSLNCRRVEPHEFAAPPHPGCALLFHAGKPILPKHRTNLSGRLTEKWISLEEVDYILAALKQSNLGVGHDRIVSPGSQRRKPQIPVEARLIRRIDARRFIQCLRFVAEGVGGPILPVVRALKLNLISAPCHHGEESVSIRNAEWLKRGDRRSRQWNIDEHPSHRHGGCVGDPSQQERSRCQSGHLPNV